MGGPLLDPVGVMTGLKEAEEAIEGLGHGLVDDGGTVFSLRICSRVRRTSWG